jgi:hypothetical protein
MSIPLLNSAISFLKQWRQERRVRKLFSELVSPEIVKQIMEDKSDEAFDFSNFKEAKVEYALVFIRGDGPVQICERVGIVCDIGIAHSAMVDSVLGALVVMTVGSPVCKEGDRSALISELKEKLGPDLKIVHGSSPGHFGLVGSQQRMSFTFIIPNFDAVLGCLDEIRFGEVRELINLGNQAPLPTNELRSKRCERNPLAPTI